jgi:OHCU decarboxylase
MRMMSEIPLPSELDREAFVATYGGVYEHSPWVAEKLAEAGLTPEDDDPKRLAARMAAVVEESGAARQLALLRLHPELAGKLKVGEALTESSQREQGGARLDQCTPEELAKFEIFNAAYRMKFGFPFIIAVTGLTRSEILSAFERRVAHSREQEFRTALDEVYKIAAIRIDALLRARDRQK